MLNTIATFALGALLAGLAVYSVLLNEADHAARRRRRKRDAPSPVREESLETLDLTGAPAPHGGGRRLPVGDFLFGALFLKGEEPTPFSELAGLAADSGLDIGQVLQWLDRAQASGLVERLEGGEPAEQPAVRLSAAGMDAARNNRRGAVKPSRV